MEGINKRNGILGEGCFRTVPRDKSLTEKIMDIYQPKAIRSFESGATRDTDNGKLKYEAFFAPRVLRRYAQYMHEHRLQPDGSMRAGDNWQKGIPIEAYEDSLVRHMFEAWYNWRSDRPSSEELRETLCAIIFNAMGYLYELTRGQE